MKNSRIRPLEDPGYNISLDMHTIHFHQQSAAVHRSLAFKQAFVKVINLVNYIGAALIIGLSRRRALQALYKLDDWQLQDIGLSRSEIQRLQRGAISFGQLARERQNKQTSDRSASRDNNIKAFAIHYKPESPEVVEQVRWKKCG